MKINFEQIFKDNTYLFFFVTIITCFAYSSWNLQDSADTFGTQMGNLLLTVLFMLFLGSLILLNLILLNKLSKNKLNSNEQIHKLGLLFRQEIWGKNDFWFIFVTIQILNLFLSIKFPNYYLLWMYALPILVILLFFTRGFESDIYLLTVILGSLLIAVLVFILINFKMLGIFYHWTITQEIPLLIYGDMEIDTPLNSVDDFYDLAVWREYGSPVPSSDELLVFKVWGFSEKLIFFSYPLVVVLALFNAINILTDTVWINLKRQFNQN
ncbi:hypothetical protein [Chryseobacterium taklimakanense]|uniref:Uncharacterized protein n=1 Tax=Chryseobacterium taklimakanense TaxID=536441 RepID=A0A3G8WMK9_9FLAO|nr:hypothetical protein [Chryseobacterium taklimakanense]AZI20727.1 hypothetical protein EIH08_08425 [Chryseobacterium taklimakanense]